MVAERWLGAPILAIQRFGPSLTILVLAICSVTSFVRLRIAAGCVVVLTMILMLQGAAAYHFGYNSHLFLMDRTTAAMTPGRHRTRNRRRRGPDPVVCARRRR